LQPYFWNAVWMTVPAVLISTAWGAVNGYVLSLWKFRGSEGLFGFLLFGVVFNGSESKPVTVGLNNFANTTSSVKAYNADMAAALISALPTFVVYVFVSQYFVRGLTAGGVKG
jgi:glucose/mannose transport system permease protein